MQRLWKCWNVNVRSGDQGGQLYPRKLQLLQKLEPDDPTKRLRFCEDLLTIFEENKSWIIFSFIRRSKISLARDSRKFQMSDSTVVMRKRCHLCLQHVQSINEADIYLCTSGLRHANVVVPRLVGKWTTVLLNRATALANSEAYPVTVFPWHSSPRRRQPF